MTAEPPSPETPAEENVAVGRQAANPPRQLLLSLPGLIAISLYLLVLAAVITLGVASGGHYPPLFLFFSVTLIAASAGLLKLFRWAWALALSAVLMLVIYNLWIFSTQRLAPAIVQGLLNLIFFLYLIRPEVRSKLR
jgi:hypothetical protein